MEPSINSLRHPGPLPSGEDTICAIATPPGTGAIATVRLSGHDAIETAQSIWRGKSLLTARSHSALYGSVCDRDGKPLDECVATIFRAPASYTGEDSVEISVHGSPWIQRELLDTLQAAGARLARPGEFTRRAFLNGRLGLTQAEAVADIIAADSRSAHRIAMSQLKGDVAYCLDALRDRLLELASLLELELDFSEEDVEFADREGLKDTAARIERETERLLNSFKTGNAIKQGFPIAIVGPTNAGKSSLLNALAGYDRAIVSDIHGTTRDTVEETVEIDEFKFRFIDTAGLRDTDDPIERLGIERTRKSIAEASVIIAMIDPDNPESLDNAAQIAASLKDSAPNGRPTSRIIAAVNKADLHRGTERLNKITEQTERLAKEINRSAITPDNPLVETIRISAKTNEGIEDLKTAISAHARRQRDLAAAGTDVIVANARHAAALAEARQATRDIRQALDMNLSPDLIAQHVRQAIEALSQITGRITSEEILQTIFARFCIGK